MSISVPQPKSSLPAGPLNGHGEIPPLETGDRLTRDEFERRFDTMPNLKKAELIEGVVYVASPVRQRQHGGPHSSLVGWLFVYRAATPGVELGDNSSVFLDSTNVPQPDCNLFIQPEHSGQVAIDQRGYIVGAPELVAEVAASTVDYDLHGKLKAYERNGVREYILWRVTDGEIDWFVLGNGKFEKLSAGEDGILRSRVFPGLWLDTAALLRNDFGPLLNVLDRGLKSPEHVEFVARLTAQPTLPATE